VGLSKEGCLLNNSVLPSLHSHIMPLAPGHWQEQASDQQQGASSQTPEDGDV